MLPCCLATGLVLRVTDPLFFRITWLSWGLLTILTEAVSFRGARTFQQHLFGRFYHEIQTKCQVHF